MRVVQINIVCESGSTGRICAGISEVLNQRSVENYILYSHGNSQLPNSIKCREKYFKLQALLSRIKGNYGFNSDKTTKKIIKQIEQIKPDIIHLHNMHGHNCNLEMLTDYFRKHKTKVIWTFHDCWTFTAYCPHYVMADCYKWKDGCHECEQIRTFSWFFDRSAWLFQKKKEVFRGLDLTITTPSLWLKSQVEDSFFRNYPVNVINNGVDQNIFIPTDSNFREKYGIANKKNILLGVAIQWVPRKGADVFIRLAKELDPDKYQIVLVGTDDEIDRQLPDNIISIHRTQNQAELAEIYSAADLFVNPTREEVFGLVNVEALACGTPVVTFDTGGSPECIDETCGSVVGVDDFDALKKEIIRICETKPYTKEACLRRAKQFDQNEKYKEYYELYKELI